MCQFLDHLELNFLRTMNQFGFIKSRRVEDKLLVIYAEEG